MATFRTSTWFGIIRLFVCGGLAARGVFILATAQGLWSTVPELILAMGCICLAGLLIAPMIAGILASPWCIIYFPRKRLRKSDLEGVITTTRRKLWFEELPFSEPSIESTPDIDLSKALDLYIEQITMAIDDMRNEELGRAILDEALTVFTKTDPQVALRAAYIRACRKVADRENETKHDSYLKF